MAGPTHRNSQRLKHQVRGLHRSGPDGVIVAERGSGRPNPEIVANCQVLTDEVSFLQGRLSRYTKHSQDRLRALQQTTALRDRLRALRQTTDTK